MIKKIEQWIRPEIRKIGAYHVPDSAAMTKLDAMENPYSLPDDLLNRWLEEMRHASLNRYPDPVASELINCLQDELNLPAGQSILLGNGSDEIIQMLAMAVSGSNRVLLAPEPGFVMYKMIATFVGMEYLGVPLDESFELDMVAMLAAIERHDPAIVFLAYPNNPSGNCWDRQAIISIIKAAHGLVVVDEAYFPFAEKSFMDDLGRFDNLLVMRTVSKMGLAGLRLGYLVGPDAWLQQINKVRLPYNINVLTQVSAKFLLDNKAVLEKQAAAIRSSRGELLAALRKMSALSVYPSDANFILLRTEAGKADTIFNALKEKKILIKNLNGGHPQLRDCLRVTVGTAEENQVFINALQHAV
ncbi:MAG: histidinol-phosphate transaminase [Gammaproteobacteria bacterium]|nr:histidinol-phosphate transaminase [Gammaproteobacteria bacterium]